MARALGPRTVGRARQELQVSQSILALGSGGVLGAGPGHGLQKVFFLPDPHTDFIFAVIGEEPGSLGTVGVLGLFVVLFLRGLKVAAGAPDRFDTCSPLGSRSIFRSMAKNDCRRNRGDLIHQSRRPSSAMGARPSSSTWGGQSVFSLNIASQMETGYRTSAVVRPPGVPRRRGR